MQGRRSIPFKIGQQMTTAEIKRFILGSNIDWEVDPEGVTIIQSPVSAEVIGDQLLYETAARDDSLSSFTYRGRCRAGEATNADPSIALKEYICSPFRSESIDKYFKFTRVRMAACKKSYMDGRIPVAPHQYFPQFIDDDDVFGRDFGLQAGIRALEECDVMTIYVIDGYVSEGMSQEIGHAIYDLHIPVRYVKLDGREVDVFLKEIEGAKQPEGN